MADIKNCCLKPARWYCDCPTPEPEEEGIDTSLRSINMAVLPSTIRGDFICDTTIIPSAVCRVEDIYYVLCCPREAEALAAQSNLGKVYAFDRVSNKIVPGYPKDVTVGHANGLCYDAARNKFLITPVFSYSTGTRTRWNEVIEYSPSWSSYTTVAAPESMMSISCDPVTNQVYVYAYSKTIYTYTNGVFKVHTNVNFNYIYTYDINQGFAVCSPYFYLSSPYGNILIGTLKDGEVFTEKCVSQTDYDEIFSLGELEDFEFYKNTNGEYFLYACRYNKIQANIYDGFVTQIYYNRMDPRPSYGVHTSSDIDYTMRISDETVTNFHNSIGYIKHPSQMNVLSQTSNSNNLEINCQTDFGDIVLGNSTNFVINGTFKFSSINIHTGYLSLYFKEASNCILTGGVEFIKIDRGANFKLVGSDNPNFITTNSFIRIAFGAYKPFITIRMTPRVNGTAVNRDNGLLQIGTTADFSRFTGAFYGSQRILLEGEA